MQQETIPSNSLKQQQQQQQMSAQQSNQLQSTFNFDDNDDLQNLAGMGDDVDLPNVFWDYDVGNIGYSEDGSISTQSVTALLEEPRKAAIINEDLATSITPAATQTPQASNTNTNTNNTRTTTQPGAAVDLANIEINNMNSYLAGFAQPALSGNLGGYPFLLPTLGDRQVAGNFPAQLPNTLLPVKTTQAQASTNSVVSQQHPAAAQAAQPNPLVNTVNILPRMNATQVINNQGNSNNTSTTSNSNNRQQPQQQQQQAIQNQLFGVAGAGFNPQLAAFHLQQQSNNQQVQNLQYLQQLQGNPQQQQLVQQQLFSNGALMQGNNPNMLPPQQQLLQPQQQQQLGLQQQQQGSQQQPPQTASQSQANSINTSIQQQLYQSQLLPLAQTGTQMMSQGGARQNSQNSSLNCLGTASHQSTTISKPNNLNTSSQLQSFSSLKNAPNNFQTSLSKNAIKAVVVSSSDTDGEHNASSHVQAKKVRRTASNSNASSVALDLSYISNDGANVKSAPAGLNSDSKKFSASDLGEDQLTEEERALANRKRNREHARNTRARKKAYLESLKTTLDELCKERDSLVSERAGAASLLLEIQKTRTDVLLSFFALRSTYEKRRPLWSSILDESFTCVMPVTPYRSFPASEVQISKCQRTVMGVDGMIADTASMHVLLNSRVDRMNHPQGQVEFRYTLIAEEAVVSGSQMMARWNMTTTNFAKLGAKREVKKMGMLCARFNSAHKIVSLELMFDVMAFMLQLKQSAGASAFTVIPNTVQSCIGPFGNAPMVMTLADRPYTIVKVNEHWENMTGWKAEDVVGKESCKILQGDRTEKISVDELTSSILYQRPAFSVLTNYTRNKERSFRNYICIYPLSADSKITHYIGLTVHTEWLDRNDKIKSEKGVEKSNIINTKTVSMSPKINAPNNGRTDTHFPSKKATNSGTGSMNEPT